MNRSKRLGMAVAGLGAVAAPLVFAVGSAGPALADPDLCISDPTGIARGCIDAPGWIDYDGPRWGYDDWHGDDDDD